MTYKDIDDKDVLLFLFSLPYYEWEGIWFPSKGKFFFYNIHCDDVFNVARSMPPTARHQTILAKMRDLIRRGLVDGCACGCSGGFEITYAGMDVIQSVVIDRFDTLLSKHYDGELSPAELGEMDDLVLYMERCRTMVSEGKMADPCI